MHVSFSFQGKIQDRIGFFPANFVQRVQQNEKIFRCVRTFVGCKEQGQITLKENQVSNTESDQHRVTAIYKSEWAGHFQVFTLRKVHSLQPYECSSI